MSESAEAGRVRAVVVDDEPTARAAVATFLAEVPEVEIVAEAGSGQEAVDTVHRHRPDLLFLDIQMPDLDGFGVLEELGDATPPAIVFVTAHDEYALRAFEVHALDYVLKPFGRPRFMAALQRALQRLRAERALSAHRTVAALLEGRRTGSEAGDLLGWEGTDTGGAAPSAPRRLGVRLGARTILVDVAEIDWIEADGDYVRLHTRDTTHLISERLRALESLLDAHRFTRIHRSVIVNLGRIRELRRDPDGGGSVVLTDGVQLRVARSRWATLEEALGLDR